jgi:hypothetical protein
MVGGDHADLRGNIFVRVIGFSCTSKVKRNTAIAIIAGWYLF